VAVEMTEKRQARREGRGDRLTLVGAEFSIFGLTVLGWVLSYSALKRLAGDHGYGGWEAWLWPLTVDLLVLASTLIAMLTARRGHGPTGEAWVMAGFASLATLAGNVLAANGDPVAMTMHAWPALCMVGAWHLFFRSIESEQPQLANVVVAAEGTVPERQSVDDRDRANAVAGPVVLALTSHGEPGTGRDGGHRRAQRRGDSRRARMAALIEQAKHEGHDAATGELARALRVSEATVRRWRSDLESEAAGPAAAAAAEEA